MKTTSMNGSSPRRRAFTMVELMTVLTIIIVLITILIPTVSRVRKASQAATVKQQISELSAAIERFYQDHHKYPGPLSDDYIYIADRNPQPTPPYVIQDVAGGPLARNDHITQSENLALGLLGGLKWMPTGAGAFLLTFDKNLMRDAKGMAGMNPNQPKKFPAYLTIDPRQLSDGRYQDGAGDADDSPIPEILDKFPNPMPILYARARAGAPGVIRDNMTNVESPANVRQYDLTDVYPYTRQLNGRSIGEGKSIRRKDYNAPSQLLPTDSDFPHGLQSVDSTRTLDKQSQYPYDAFPYFRNPTIAPTVASNPETGTARSKDRYVLISAGIDRIYGTEDDICSFGSVTE
jgi:type II secretory pathway pseudopilin PulG